MGRGLVHIIQLNPLKIDLDLDDQTVQYVRKGMPVRLHVEQVADSGELTGTIEWVNPEASPMGRTFSARVIVQNDKNLLRPGYFVEVHIIIGEKKNALIVPRQAFVDNRMFVVKDSLARSVKVELGWITDEVVEALSGIKENDKVIVTGNKALPDSAQVNVVNAVK
jgi:membrane fusion protein (multidrug efflux system)